VLLGFHRRLVSLAALLVSPPFLFAWQAQQLGNIQGEIWISRGGQPDSRVLVELQVRGGAISSVYSDDEGKFGFYALPANPYHVVIRDEHFDPVDLLVNVNPLITMNTVARVMLKPRDAEKQPSNPNIPGGNPYLVNLEEYSKHFSKNVLKEFDKGSKSSAEGDLEGSIKHYKKALAIAPDYYPAHNDLGSVYLKKRDFASAQQEFQKAMQENPSDANAYFNLANLMLMTQRYAEGANFASQGLAKQPNSATGLFFQGCLDRHLGRFDDAERSLRNALSQDPTLANAHLELVNLYRQEENRPLIIAELESFLKLYPSNPMAPRVREALQKLTAGPAK